MRVTYQVVTANTGLITAQGYLNRDGGLAIAAAAVRLRAQGCRKLLIDLAGTRLFNHHGITTLCDAVVEKKARVVDFAVYGLSPMLSRVLELSELGLTSRVFPSSKAAREELSWPDERRAHRTGTA